MRVCAVSDLHGNLPDTPECDLLLIAGDLTLHSSRARERDWLDGPFREWLKTRPAERIVGVAGNHDFYAERDPDFMGDLPWVYLQDETTTFGDHVIHGSPWSNWFGNWAFMAHDTDLIERAELIPNETTILITHGPPYGIGDLTFDHRKVGSNAFRRRASELPNLELYVFGHIHESRGKWVHDGVIFANVTMLDLGYKIYRDPVLEVSL